jgi:anti-anti-sigma regulatory factor
MDELEPVSVIEIRRARQYTVILLGLVALFVPLGLIDGLTSGSWINLIVGSLVAAAILVYRATLRPDRLRAGTLLFLLVQDLAISSVVHNTGGFVAYMVAVYCLTLFGAGFILAERRWIFGATAMTIVTYVGLAVLELNRLVPLNEPTAIMLQTPRLYQIFAILSSAILLIGSGLLIALVMGLVQARERSLDAARREAGQRSAEMDALTTRLQAANRQLQETEGNLRSTVDALTVTALPLADGVLVLPLIGAFDAQRADAVIGRLLATVHAQRASAVVLDLTGVAAATPTLLAMLNEIITSVRLLGAQVVLAGLQPELASAVVDLKVNLAGIISVPTLASALETLAGRQSAGTAGYS